MANVFDNDLEVSEFEIQGRYFIHIWSNTFGKGMNPPHAMD